MDEKSENGGQETVELLREILKWIKFDGMQRVKGTLTDVLQKDVEKIIYEFSDGKSSIEIARIAGVSHQTVVNYWKRWSRIGIVEGERTRGGIRYRRVFSLEDFGIEVPQPKKEASKEEPVSSQEPLAQKPGEEVA